MIFTNNELLKHFESFYSEIIILKKQIAIASTTENEAIAEYNPLEIFEKTKKHLIDFLIKKKKELQNHHGLSQSTLQDMFYLMAALADEIFLNSPWSASKYWEHSMLEAHFFHTQIAGELVFQKINHLLNAYDASFTDMALIYFLILSLGFKGKYRSIEKGDEKIKFYMRQLYILFHQEYPKMFHVESDTFCFKQPYTFILALAPRTHLPNMRLWIAGFTGIFFLYLFLTQTLWYDFTSHFHDSLSDLSLKWR